MNQLRLFFVIDLPEHLKEESLILAKKEEKDIWRWTPKENLHLTLIFIGYLDEAQLPKVLEAGQNVCRKKSSFILKARSINYGPENNSRMIWLNLEKNDPLASLKNDLEKALSEREVNFSREYREFHPHITLARLKLGCIKPSHQIRKDYIEDFLVKEMILMASNLQKSGPKYTVLQKFSFQ